MSQNDNLSIVNEVRGTVMNIKTLGVDLAKNIFQLHGVNEQGKVVLKKRVSVQRF